MYYDDETASDDLDTGATTADTDAGDTTGQGEYNKDTVEEKPGSDSQTNEATGTQA